MAHPFDRFNSNERDTLGVMCFLRRMTPLTPPRGRCFTPTAIHHFSARQRPARTPTLPMAESTQPDDLLPACVEARPALAEETLRGTRDGARYQSFVRKLSEEVVLHSDDSRREPTMRIRKA